MPKDRRPDCPQPLTATGESCTQTGYCLCYVFDDAQQRCIDKGQGWRWGVKDKDDNHAN